MEVGGLGERVVGQPRGRQSGCRFEVGGNRDKQGSDGDDDDGGHVLESVDGGFSESRDAVRLQVTDLKASVWL